MLVACGPRPGQGEEDKKEEAVIPVEVGAVSRGPIQAAYRGTATLEAREEATVLAKQAGVIERLLVEEGDRVSAGQVLARLETEKLRYEVARTGALLAKLRQNFERNASVYQRNLVSREAYESSKAELDAQQAAHDAARLALSESEIKAPFDGVVTARFVKLGNLVQANAPTFRITQLDQLEAAIHVPERDIHKLAPAHPVRLAVDAWPGELFQGRIDRINPVVDAASGTVKVTVAMDPGQAKLRPGMFARAEIVYDTRDAALLLPKDAVLSEDSQQSVFVVEGERARRVSLRTGYSDADHYEVLEGLEAGAQVVVTGQANLKDQAKVVVVNAAPASGSAPAAAAAAGGG
ncbi:MAG TPA: efflux RND transporter periplasmic adaptor subunit [Nevskiaceae bacterium]|nr:efflux RND transporter periplasmic adaptor subunit [Nevskiaceae bacterium]